MNVVLLTTLRAERTARAQAQYEAEAASLLARVLEIERARRTLRLAAAEARSRMAHLNLRHSGGGGCLVRWPAAARAQA